jgi:hypothetical protein
LNITSSLQGQELKSGNPLYDLYTLTYSGLGSSFYIPALNQTDNTLLNKTIAFKIVGSTSVFLAGLGQPTTQPPIKVDGVSETFIGRSSSFILKGTGTIGEYTTHPYQEYSTTDQLTLKSNLDTDANTEFTGIRFLNTNTDAGLIRVETDRPHNNSAMRFYTRSSNNLIMPLEITSSVNAINPYLVNGVNICSIGYNQTWQTPTRAVNTWYQNTTGRPINVMASFTGNNDANESRFVLELSTTNTAPITTFSGIYADVAFTANDSNQFTLKGIIPSSGQVYYRIVKLLGGNTSWGLIYWSELR